jgi:acylglycerol lipase
MKQWWEKYVSTVPGAGVFFPEEDWLSLTSASGRKLMTYRFHIDNPRGLLFVFHGLFAESNVASMMAQQFSRSGFEVLAMDQESHGKSEGTKGTVRRFAQFGEDSLKFVLKAKEHYPEGLPVFLMGHSMGGAIATMVALSEPKLIRGAILLAPGLCANPDFEPGLRKLVRCMNVCCGCLPTKKLDRKTLSRNEDAEGFWDDNPNTFKGKMKVSSVVAMLDGLDELQRRVYDFSVPVIVVQGTVDNIVSEKENRKFVEMCKSQDKDIWIYDGMYHDIYIEPEIVDIIPQCIDWAVSRL